MKKIFIMGAAFFPAIILAADAEKTGIAGLLDTISGLLSSLYGVIVAAIIVAFAWGILMFVMKTGEEKEKGKMTMVWSIVAIAVLFSVYGIIGILQSSAGVDKNTTITAPTLPSIS